MEGISSQCLSQPSLRPLYVQRQPPVQQPRRQRRPRLAPTRQPLPKVRPKPRTELSLCGRDGAAAILGDESGADGGGVEEGREADVARGHGAAIVARGRVTH